MHWHHEQVSAHSGILKQQGGKNDIIPTFQTPKFMNKYLLKQFLIK